MLREKDVTGCREHQSQLPSLSPGMLSQPSTAPHAANRRAEKQRARGSGQRLREKTAETEKSRNKEMKKRGGMDRKEPGSGESIKAVCAWGLRAGGERAKERGGL